MASLHAVRAYYLVHITFSLLGVRMDSPAVQHRLISRGRGAQSNVHTSFQSWLCFSRCWDIQDETRVCAKA